MREDAGCAEILANAALVRRDELLHGIRGVGTVVQDLRESRVTGTHAGERIAQRFRVLRSFLALVAKRGQLSVKVRNLLLRSCHLPVRGLEHVCGFLGVAYVLEAANGQMAASKQQV